MGSKAMAQIDTLNVYLEKSQKHPFGVNLVFENNSNDTILLFTRFHNFSLGGEMVQNTGISIDYYHNDRKFAFNWGEMPPLFFSFSKGFTLINPKSHAKLFFNVGEYFRFPEKSAEKFEVGFFMNYIYGKYRDSSLPTSIKHFETNRVTIVEPMEETKNKNEEEGKNK
jgi:hypothetical protein